MEEKCRRECTTRGRIRGERGERKKSIYTFKGAKFQTVFERKQFFSAPGIHEWSLNCT